MANFTILPAELKMCILEQIHDFGDLFNLCLTCWELLILFKAFSKHFIASVLRNYDHESASFMPWIHQAHKLQDFVVSSLRPSIYGTSLITYSISEQGPHRAFDPIEEIKFYDVLTVDVYALVDFCISRVEDCGYITLLDKNLREIRCNYLTAMWKFVWIIICATRMELFDIGQREPTFYNPREPYRPDSRRLIIPMRDAKMSFVIHKLNKIPFDELLAIGDILVVTRLEMRTDPSTTQRSPYANNKIFRLLGDYQTEGDTCAMLLLGHVWTLIRDHRDRRECFETGGLSYRLAQYEIFQELARDIDTRVLYGEMKSTLGELPLVPIAHHMKWVDLRMTAALHVYDALAS